MKLTNELVRNTYEFGEMAASNKIMIDGGKDLTFHALIEANTMGRNVEPWEVRSPKQTNHLQSGSIDWSIFEADWAIEEIEQAINSGESKILSLVEANQEAMITSSQNLLEEQWWDENGGFDNYTDAKRPLMGVKAWVTRDGRGQGGSTTVFGINTTNFPRWVSRYVGPNGNNLYKDCADGTAAGDKLTSGAQLRGFMQRSMRYARFASPNGSKFSNNETAKTELLKKQKIYADEIGYTVLERTGDALGHGSDHLKAAELDRPEPVFKGVPITFIEDLGLGSGGIPTAGAHGDIGGGTLTAAAYPNTGEVFMMNLNFFKIGGLENNLPLRKKLVFLDLQQILWQLYRWIMQTICISRQRQVGLWGFSPITSQ
jgi:hypothetical protein